MMTMVREETANYGYASLGEDVAMQKALDCLKERVHLYLIDYADLPKNTYMLDCYKDCYIFRVSYPRNIWLLCSTEYVAVNKTTGKVSSFSGNDEG